MAPIGLDPFNLLLGFFLSVIAGICFGLGIILQKKALLELPEIKLNDSDALKSMIKNKTWLFGISLALIGGLPYIIVQALIGVALTQPLVMGMQLVFVAVFAVLLLKERLSKMEIFGFLIIILSPLFLILGAVSPPMIIIGSLTFALNLIFFFLIPTIIAIILCFILSHRLKNNDVSFGLLNAVISGLLFAIGATMAQICVEIIKVNINLILIALLFFGFLMLTNTFATGIQQVAFQKGKVGIAIALQATSNLFFTIYAGIFVFNQLISVPFFFIIGIILILIGNILLIQFQARLEKIESRGLENGDTNKPTMD